MALSTSLKILAYLNWRSSWIYTTLRRGLSLLSTAILCCMYVHLASYTWSQSETFAEAGDSWLWPQKDGMCARRFCGEALIYIIVHSIKCEFRGIDCALQIDKFFQISSHASMEHHAHLRKRKPSQSGVQEIP
jgi:hypothetical protein